MSARITEPPKPDDIFYEGLEQVVFEIDHSDGQATEADLVGAICVCHVRNDRHAEELLRSYQRSGLIQYADGRFSYDAAGVERELSVEVRHAWEIARVRELLSVYWERTDGGLGNETLPVLAAALFEIREEHVAPIDLWRLSASSIADTLRQADFSDVLAESDPAAHCAHPRFRRP